MRKANAKREGRSQEEAADKKKGKEKELGEMRVSESEGADRKGDETEKKLDRDFKILLDEQFACTKDWERELLVAGDRGGALSSDDR